MGTRIFPAPPNNTCCRRLATVLTSRAVAQLDPDALAAALRAHWGIENALHHRRDRT